MASNRPTPGHAFISYVREDAARIDRLQRMLEAAGIPVWRDTADLWPGEDWRIKIRQAITDGAMAFIACFSEKSNARESSYQNEELVLAVEQFRLRPPDRAWLIPVRLDDCSIPTFDLGAGRTLGSLQRVDLFGEDHEASSARLVGSVLRILSRAEVPEPPGQGGPQPTGNGRPTAFVKGALLDSARQIELEDFVLTRADEAAEHLRDEDRFPTSDERLRAGSPVADRFLAGQAEAYAEAVAPILDALVAGCAWGQENHNRIWSLALERVASTADVRSGMETLLELRRWPIVLLVYASGLAALHRDNFGALKAVCVDARFRALEGTVPMVGACHTARPFGNAMLAANILALEADGTAVSDEMIEALRTGRQGKRFTPASDYLHAKLRDALRPVIRGDEDYTDTFDRLEVLLGVVAADVQLEMRRRDLYVDGPWTGSFSWRNRYGPRLEDLLSDQIDRDGEDWPPLSAGLFDGSMDRARTALAAFKELADRVRANRW